MCDQLTKTDFSENDFICCVCTQIQGSKCRNISESFLKVNSKYESLKNIILHDLALIFYKLKPDDELRMKICNCCESNVINFFIFKRQIAKAQSNFVLCVEPAIENEEESTDQPLVLHTLDIVKDFIERHSVQSIVEDEDEQRLIIGKYAQTDSCIKQEKKESTFKQESLIVEEVEDADENLIETSTETDQFEDLIEDQSDIEMEDEDEHEIVEEEATTDSIEFIERSSYKIDTSLHELRRPRNPENWIRNIRKNARSRGCEYTTSEGKLVPAKRMKSPCKPNCRMKCRTKITDDDRERNFIKYWDLGSSILQRKFIHEHHKTVPVKRRRSRIDGGKSREYSSQYYLDSINSNGSVEQVHVCEKMFLNTIDICKNIVLYLHKKVKTGIVEDLRGINPRKLTPGHEAAIEQIKANRFYLVEKSNPVSKLYEQYKVQCMQKQVEAVRIHTYRVLFKKYNECDFLKSDSLCGVCNEYYKSTTDEEKALLIEGYKQHLKTNEKCLQRAKARERSARKASKRKVIVDHGEIIEQETPGPDDMIVEEHLNENEEI